jgi:hypothetical protein
MFDVHDRSLLNLLRLDHQMNRTLIERTNSEGYITSGKCSVCGQLFTTSAVAPAAGEDAERELVRAFGSHECSHALKSTR